MAALVASPQDTPSTVATVVGDASFPQDDQVSDKISAYYSLVFPNFTYYLQTLNVTIGRRCIPANTASSSDNPQVDVDLGPLKSVSRLHAKIEYEEEEERFRAALAAAREEREMDLHSALSSSGSRLPSPTVIAAALAAP